MLSSPEGKSSSLDSPDLDKLPEPPSLSLEEIRQLNEAFNGGRGDERRQRNGERAAGERERERGREKEQVRENGERAGE